MWQVIVASSLPRRISIVARKKVESEALRVGEILLDERSCQTMYRDWAKFERQS